MNDGDFKAPTVLGGGGSGISLVFLTVDTEEHATRLVKDLMKHKLAASVTMQEGGFNRSYLKFGRPSSESHRVELEIQTNNEKVAGLIDWVNNNNPTDYDYPVPNLTVMPVANGNADYLQWV